MSLAELHSNGTIKELFRKGLISCTILSYFDYNETFLKHRKNNLYRDAVMMAAKDHAVSDTTIERAIRKLK